VPAGVEAIHPDWLRARLEAEPSAIVRAVTAGLPDAVRGVGAAVLAARGEDAGGASTGAGANPDAADRLQRAVFGGLVPLAGPGAPTGAISRELGALPAEALAAEVERRGAEVLGVSLRGAPAAVVARAAATLGPSLARTLIAAAGQDGAATARDDARRLVASIGKRPSAEAARELGARALAAALAAEGFGAVAAVAQRLPIALGRALAAAAAERVA
jgi:hypothetical protein